MPTLQSQIEEVNRIQSRIDEIEAIGELPFSFAEKLEGRDMDLISSLLRSDSSSIENLASVYRGIKIALPKTGTYIDSNPDTDLFEILYLMRRITLRLDIYSEVIWQQRGELRRLCAVSPIPIENEEPWHMEIPASKSSQCLSV